jgi:hypothetical protein
MIDDKVHEFRNLLEKENTRIWFSKVLTIRRAPHE